jgi:hypothetical protein
MTLVALDKVENKVTDVEGSSLDPMTVVLEQCLLVLGQVQESNVVGFVTP